jgi:hypothetical protein
MKTKPISPYARLLNEFRDYVNGIDFRRRARMWTYPKEKLAQSQWYLYDLAERTSAADQLGFDVQLKVKDGALEVWYIKRPPDRPMVVEL